MGQELLVELLEHIPGVIDHSIAGDPVDIALFMIALPLSSVIGAPISTSLLDIRAAGLEGWQWMFLLEAIPTIVLGVAVLGMLTNRPAEAKWLTADERSWLERALAAEHANANDLGPTASHEHTMSLRQALLLPRVWRHGLVYFTVLVGLYGFSFWLPQIIATLGRLTNLQVGLMTTIPYALSCIAIVAWGRHSDATGERSWHVAAPPLVAALALAASGGVANPLLAFAALCLAAVGIYACLPAFWALASRGLQGAAGAGAIALINSIGNLGGFLGPTAIGLVKERTGSYAASLLFIALCLAFGAALVLWERAREARTGAVLNQVSQ